MVEDLRAELLLCAGSCGIPLGVALPRDASLADLVTLRQEKWVETVVRNKRGRLDMLAAGRSKSFQKIVSQLGDFLSGLERGMADTVLLEQLNAIHMDLNALAEEVRSE